MTPPITDEERRHRESAVKHAFDDVIDAAVALHAERQRHDAFTNARRNKREERLREAVLYAADAWRDRHQPIAKDKLAALRAIAGYGRPAR
jgi:hypothetical protein